MRSFPVLNGALLRLFSPRFWGRALSVILQMTFSRIAMLIYGFFLRARHKERVEPFSLNGVGSILVTQLADIGDTVLSSAFLRELRRAFPDAWIGLVVQPGIRNLVEACPYVDEILSFDWRIAKNWRRAVAGHPLWWLSAFRLALRSGLLRRRVDLAISTRWGSDACQSASAICNFAGGAQHRVGYRLSADELRSASLFVEGLATSLSTCGPIMQFPKHEVERQLDILRYLGIKPANDNLEVWIRDEDLSYAQTCLRSLLATGAPLIGFAPGAGWVNRQWPTHYFAELGNWLQTKYGARIIIVGGQKDHVLGEEINRGLSKSSLLNLAGKTTLRQMAAVASFLTMVIANDAGPMHIAAAAGVPTIGLFGSGEYQRFRPWGTRHSIVRLDLPCCPCGEHCVHEEPRCILGLTVDMVKPTVMAKLDECLAPRQNQKLLAHDFEACRGRYQWFCSGDAEGEIVSNGKSK